MKLKKPLYTVPVPSTEFAVGTYWDGSGARPGIRFVYSVNGSDIQGGIEFAHISAMRKRAERCCTAWHIEGVYDTLCEVTDSQWALEIRSDTTQHLRSKYEMHHYMIYLDSVGCFEVIAESWSAQPAGDV